MALPTLRIIGFILGIFLITLAVSMIIPMLTLLAYERTDDLQAFIWGSLITFSCGFALVAPGKPANTHLRPRDMYFLTTISWVVVCCFAALPLMLIQHISYSDAFFETMSGITTTGAESSDWSEKVMPRSHVAGQYLLVIYVTFTIAAFIAFLLTGMGAFDAINHAMSTVATGGFSTSDASMGKFGPSAHWVAVFFMIVGSLPFTLYVMTLRGHRTALFRDQQVRGFVLMLAITSVLFSGWYWLNNDVPALDALRIVTFSVVSVVTTTGFAVDDYTQWGGFAVMAFFYLTFIGGCSGSTSGGLKMFRFQVAYSLLRANFKQLIHPRAVIRQQYNGHNLDEEIVRSILTFSFFITMTIGVLALCLALLGLDPITALTGAATAVCNVGPGLGEIIGPAGNFSTLPDTAKWLLSIGMLLGRLEIITVLVLLTPAFWRH